MEELENESLSPRSAGRGFVFVIGVAMLLIGLMAGFLLSGGSEKSVLGDSGALVLSAFERMMGKEERSEMEIALAPSTSSPVLDAEAIKAAFDPLAQTSSPKKPKAAPLRPRAPVVAPAPKAAKAKDTEVKAAALSLEPPECTFAHASPTHVVLLNEIAWMGTKQDSSGEWIELRNNAGFDVPLAGWQLLSEDENLAVRFGPGDVVRAGGFYILERKHDRVLKKVRADRLFEGSISNRGAWLRLVDERCGVIDEVNAQGGWKSLGGESASKRTLERDMATLDWGTSALAGGTPAAPNRTELVMRTSADSGSSGATPAPAEEDGSEETTAPAPAEPGQVVIGEVLAGTESRADEEFIELWNTGAGPVDLTGWSLKKRSSSGAESTLVSASRLEGRSIPGNGRLLMGNQAGWTGDPPAGVTWPGSYTLAYVSNGVLLVEPGGIAVDELSWTELPKGQSISRNGGGLAIGAPTPGH